MISVISALIACGFVYLIVKELTGSKLYGLLASLLPATQPIFRDWTPMARVDMPAVMFDIIGFYIVVKYGKSKWIYLAVVLFLVAIMIKLTAVAGLVTALIYLFIINKKRFLIFSGIMVAGLLALLVPLMVVSNGLYWKHTILYQNTIQNIDIPVFMINWQMFFYAFMGVFILAVIYLRRNFNAHRITLAGLFFIVAFLMNSFATFRAGSAGMYYYEAIFGGSICAALAWRYLNIRKRESAIVTLCILVVVLAIFGVKTTMALPSTEYAGDINRVTQIIQDTDKPIVTENAALVMRAGKEIAIEPFIFTNLSRLGYWDESCYIRQYQAQYYDYVLLKVSLEQKELYESLGFPDSNFTKGVMQAINDNYTLVYSNNNLASYNDPKQDWRQFLCLYEANRLIMGE